MPDIRAALIAHEVIAELTNELLKLPEWRGKAREYNGAAILDQFLDDIRVDVADFFLRRTFDHRTEQFGNCAYTHLQGSFLRLSAKTWKLELPVVYCPSGATATRNSSRHRMFHWNSRAYASWMHRIVKKTKVASEPEALGNSFGVPGITVKQIGVEAGPLLQWLHAGLKRAGLMPFCLRRGIRARRRRLLGR